MRPDFAVVSAGKGNAYGFPHRNLLARMEEAGARVLRTDHGGAIRFVSDGKQLWFGTWQNKFELEVFTKSRPVSPY